MGVMNAASLGKAMDMAGILIDMSKQNSPVLRLQRERAARYAVRDYKHGSSHGRSAFLRMYSCVRMTPSACILRSWSLLNSVILVRPSISSWQPLHA
jgi:hypothetical protein